jgi:hypothetical protein
LSVVFQHWDLEYFATILDTAGECGAELKAAVTHTGDVIWSMHKKKNSESVLAGEMVLTFYKPIRRKKPVQSMRNGGRADTEKVLSEVFDTCLEAGTESFTNESLFNRLVLELWRRRALGCLALNRERFSHELAQRGWTYDSHSHLWSHNSKSPTDDSLLFQS